jgi:hypothetical protein
MILLLTSISLLAVGSHPPVLDFFQMLEPPRPLDNATGPRMSQRERREFRQAADPTALVRNPETDH